MEQKERMEQKNKGALWLNEDLHYRIKIEALKSKKKVYKLVEEVMENYLSAIKIKENV